MRLTRLVSAAILAMASVSAQGADINVTGLAITCNNCHGLHGASAGGAMPSIGGQPKGYLKTVMGQFKDGSRYNTAMGRLVKGYTDDELATLAEYYSKQPWVSAGEKADDALVLKGKTLHGQKCLGCHGPNGELSNDAMPRIAGQPSGFIVLEMEKYLDPKFNMPGKVMEFSVKGLSAEDVKALAAFYASQK
jgi:cytochrome subunit of sulfide dehydrogenase